MYSSGLELNDARHSAVKLGPCHGYRVDGDLVSLNVELAISPEEPSMPQEWALQLWACETPYAGGSLAGIKVAEAQLALPPSAEPFQRLDAATPARLPAGQRDYSMVLVLATGHAGSFDQVHDFANYPARERFSVPHFDGAVGYRIENDTVVVSVEHVRNPRAEDNLSGSLALELWALAGPYRGGSLEGERVAGTQLPRIPGQTALERQEHRMQFSEPRAGLPQLVLMLREWTAAGYDTRDFCNFATPYARQVAWAPSEAPPRVELADPAASEAPTTPAATATPQLVSVQHASLEELVRVKGLNKRLAVEIIKARPFASLEQLIKVRGIGDKMLRKLRDHLTV